MAIARRLTDRVVVREWAGYLAQKNYAASLASHDWILSLDADERVTPALADEITTTQSQRRPRMPHFVVPRVTWHLGRWIRTTDWYPDHQLRLYDRRRRLEWTGRYVHETLSVTGNGRSVPRGELEHFAYRDIADHLETIDRYTTYAARQMHEDGRRSGLAADRRSSAARVSPQLPAEGRHQRRRPGLVISAMNTYYVFLKFAKLWELEVHGSGSGSRFAAQVPGSESERTGTLNREP